eukprot:16431309-Heterocapsa_arctica.AAC.1
MLLGPPWFPRVPGWRSRNEVVHVAPLVLVEDLLHGFAGRGWRHRVAAGRCRGTGGQAARQAGQARLEQAGRAFAPMRLVGRLLNVEVLQMIFSSCRTHLKTRFVETCGASRKTSAASRSLNSSSTNSAAMGVRPLDRLAPNTFGESFQTGALACTAGAGSRRQLISPEPPSLSNAHQSSMLNEAS